MENKNLKYKFSVIVPIYNVEDYLDETIDSVINQDIGFKENIQLILVNDGSEDDSEKICLKYKKMYPDNVIYVKQNNQGVSAARNTGIKYIEGKYTNFLDADDKWNLNVFNIAWKFFEKNYEDIDFIACRMKFFEARENYHILDFKFNKNKIVNILDNYDYIQLTNSATFLKSDIVRKFKYDENLKYFEDATLISKILLNNPKYGILKDAVYNVRKRDTSNSATQTQKYSKEYYIDTIERAHKEIFRKSIQKYGFVLPYFQYLVMYDIGWRLKLEKINVLTDEEIMQYDLNIKLLLSKIEDYIIVEQKHIYSEHKLFALSLKYNRDIRDELEYRDGFLYYNNIKIFNLKNANFFSINILEVKENYVHIEGRINDLLKRDTYTIKFMDDNNCYYDLKYFSIGYTKEKAYNGIEYHQWIGYKVDIPIKKIKKLRAKIRFENIYERTLKIKFGDFVGLNDKSEDSYKAFKNYIIKSKNNDQLLIIKNKKGKRKAYERKYIKYLSKINKKNLIWYRKMYTICKKIKKQKIWIISDRATSANDNGLQLFKYLVKNEKKAKIYFVIDKNCPDYEKVKKIGKVLKLNSAKYKLTFLLSDIIISSQLSEFATNPFEQDKKFMSDLYKYKLVFLQHGITKDDISCWTHKQLKNIKLFVTAVNPEYDSIINGDYGYTKQDVKLTGFPRFDALKNDRKNYITIMPTWRKKLASKVDREKDERLYNENFKQSEYFMFYNNLINDERIKDCLNKNKYKIRFCIHPNHKQQCVDFDDNEFVEIVSENINYQKEFAEAALLVSDYSSTPFDFAYLGKPVIYTQFDKEDFFESHTYQEGYFNYERDGFGPVCYDYETTVQEIIKAIQKKCKIDEIYINRINNFFAYHDKNNCKRVHEEILKLE